MEKLNFEEWKEKVEENFKRKKSERNFSFEQWFDDQKDLNEKIKVDFLEYNLNSGKFIALKIAETFYPNLIKRKAQLISNTDFNNDKSYGKAIKNAMEKGLSLNRLERFLNEKQDSDNEDKNNTWYWVEICSALQKNYNLFTNINDINTFLTKVATPTSNKELRDYGLYVRDIDDLCIAYGILNGKSFDEIKSLIVECRNIISNKQQDELYKPNAEETVTQELVGDFAGLSGKNKDEFIYAVEDKARKFLPVNSYRHWSTYKKWFELILGPKYLEWIQNERNFDERIGHIYNYLVDELLPHLDERIEKYIGEKKIDSLDKYILNEFKLTIKPVNKKIAVKLGELNEQELEKKAEEQDQEAIDSFEESLSWLRRVCIISMIKAIYCDASQVAVKSVLDELNENLEDCNLRPIDYKYGDGIFENTATDIFDWFIVECIVRDKEEHPQDGYVVSGFEPFCKFMGFEI